MGSWKVVAILPFNAYNMPDGSATKSYVPHADNKGMHGLPVMCPRSSKNYSWRSVHSFVQPLEPSLLEICRGSWALLVELYEINGAFSNK